MFDVQHLDFVRKSNQANDKADFFVQDTENKVTLTFEALMRNPFTMLVVYLPILMGFGVALSLGENVNEEGSLTGNPCVRSTPLTKYIPSKDLWLKSAQLLAFCYDQVSNPKDQNN